MNLREIKEVPIPRKGRIRLGRGTASGKGKTCGKGMKGQNSRSGVTLPIVFEGGTMPLYRRIPKRGFTNRVHQADWVIVNVEDLNTFEEGTEVSLAKLAEVGVISAPKSKKCRLKILGRGELKVKNLKIKAHKISKHAAEQLEKNGGSIEIVEVRKYIRPRRKRS